jgi:hypothetical protein
MTALPKNLVSRRNLTRSVEFLALIPATFLLAPFMFYGMVGMVIALADVAFGDRSSVVKFAMLKPMLALLSQMLLGCASLACLWILLTGGMSKIKPRPPLRALAITLLVLGMFDAAYFLVSDPGMTAALVSSTWSIVLWTGLLLLPVLLGIRYVCLLLLPARPPKIEAG